MIMDILANSAKIEISFTQWTLLFAPLAIFTILLCGIWTTFVFKPEKVEDSAIRTLNEKLSESGKLKKDEIKTILIILAMLVCWLLGTWIPVLNVTVVAIVGMTLLFFPGIQVITWDEAVKKTNWNLAFTIGSVSVLIGGMTSTGIMDWIVNGLFSGITGWSLPLMFLVIGLIVEVIRAFIPTAPAIAALFGAPLISLAAITGASPVALLMIPAFWACSPMLLWIEPIFLFSYGYGYYKPQDVLKFGIVPSIILIALMSFTPYYVGLLGL